MRKYGPVSRAEISRLLGLSKPAISESVKKLIEANLLKEVGFGNNAAGRKGKLLVFNANKAFIIGVDIGNFKLRIALANLSGEIIDKREAESYIGIRGVELVGKLDKAIDETLAQNQIARGEVLAICVGIPGVYNEKLKKNMLIPYIVEFEDFDLVSHFNSRFQALCIIENNINLAVVGEKWLRDGEIMDDRKQNFVYLNIGIGIGAGVLINGELYTGLQGAAGEIAFCCFRGVPENGEFSREGTFERAISSKRMIESYNRLSGENLPLDSAQSILRIFRRYDRGDEAACHVVGDLLENIKLLLINMTALLNPDMIIFGGGMGERISKYFPELEKVLKYTVPYVPVLSLAKCGPYSGMYGAIAVAKRIINADYRNISR